MKSWFLKRGYPENIINREMEKAKFKKQVFSRTGGVTVLDIFSHVINVEDNM